MPRTPSELRDYADDHVLYEIRMVAALTARMARHEALFENGLAGSEEPLAEEVLEIAGRNADIEAWATHVSNVFNFLYCNRKHADVVAYDYFPRHHDWTARLPRPPKSLERLNARVPTEIDHLSFGRTRVKDKTWMYEQTWHDLADVLRLFVDAVPRDRVRDSFLTSVRALLPSDPVESVDTLTRKMRVGVTETPHKFTATSHQGGTVTLMPRSERLPDVDP